MILLMSVNPGFGGQSFIGHTVDKLRRLRQMVDKTSNRPMIEIDGGVNEQTAPLLSEAGADILVAGNYIFKSKDKLEAIKKLKEL